MKHSRARESRMRDVSTAAPTHAKPAQRSATSRGQSLATSERAGFDRAFEHSFGDVQVHADAEGHAVAEQYGAEALAIGEDLFFSQGAYAPDTIEGRRLLAHELAHVVQQSTSPGDATRPAVEESATLESDAWSAGDRAALGFSASVMAAPSAGIVQLSGGEKEGDKITGNEGADHSISGGIASLMTGADEYAVSMARGVGLADPTKPAYTQTIGWQLANLLD